MTRYNDVTDPNSEGVMNVESRLTEIKDKLDNEIAEYINDGIQYDNQTGEFISISDISWLVEQTEKVKMYERALKLIIKNTVSGHIENIAKKALSGKF